MGTLSRLELRFSWGPTSVLIHTQQRHDVGVSAEVGGDDQPGDGNRTVETHIAARKTSSDTFRLDVDSGEPSGSCGDDHKPERSEDTEGGAPASPLADRGREGNARDNGERDTAKRPGQVSGLLKSDNVGIHRVCALKRIIPASAARGQGLLSAIGPLALAKPPLVAVGIR